jgi:hypothetical protein
VTGGADPIGRAHRRLHAAGSIDAILDEVARFLDGLPHEHLEQVAHDCRPRRVATQQDLKHWCDRLERYRMLGSRGTRSPGFRVVHDFFLHAAARAYLVRPRRDPDPAVVTLRRVAPPGPRPSARRPS